MERAVGPAGGVQRLFPCGDRLPDRLISGLKIPGLADRSSHREAADGGGDRGGRFPELDRMTLVGTATEPGCRSGPHAEHLAPVVTRLLAGVGSRREDVVHQADP
ncbi:hypothetical protein ACG83_19290 [Frankia sp. R43]|uniref:hypothetical protein n=1 Tax=Frankia sp. R43 TaxID=269536 RepID=UPI0006CA1D10|nr:hypothetical protein [Frankia sp. R43]KPM54162.1 hypothetical protein ACG83_19290 [Frankia sp. R43]